jgi:hypothetical protein
MASSFPDPHDSAASAASRLPNWIVIGFIAGGAITAVVWGIFALVGRHGSLTILTEEDLDAAEERWIKNEPPNYDLDVVLEGARQGTIHVEVRDDEVTAMTIDGRAPTQRRTWDVWTVPGQFDMIRLDLENAERQPQEAFGVRERADVTLRVEFDQKLGYPRQYERLVSGGAGEIRWKVVRFATVE